MDTYRGIFRARPSNYRLVHYEAEVYRLVYGRAPMSDLQLNYRRPKKEHQNLYWDHMIEEDTIDGLIRIPRIDIIEVNQGKDSKLLTHLVIRTVDQSPEYTDRVASKLNDNVTKSKVGVGVGNQIIIYIATKNWYRYDANNDTFKKWWAHLPQKITKALM